MANCRVVVLCCACLMAAPAFAQSVEVKKYLNAAVTLFENLEYEKALKQLQRARSKAQGADDEGKIALLEGVVFAEMGKEEQALTAFKSGFGMDVKAKLPVEVSRKVASLAERARANVLKVLAPQLEQERLEAEKKALDEKRKSDEEAAAAQRAETKQREDSLRQREAVPTVAVEQGPTLRSRAWIPGAIGLLGAGVATYFFVNAGAKARSLQTDMTLTESAAASLRDAGRTSQTAGFISAAVAVAGLGTAAVFFLFGGPKADASTPTLGFVVVPGGGLVTVGFEFGAAR